jgi:hypothetical protein
MRQEEICRIEWRDFDRDHKLPLIGVRKDPERKNGNNQRIPLLDVCGYDASQSATNNKPGAVIEISEAWYSSGQRRETARLG